ncbi:MAG: hypothetical protein KAI47_02730 [Deltaproteobacteria bacterium]|nr:hypothetical protein [Deltaproteobacteria bacterium]
MIDHTPFYLTLLIVVAVLIGIVLWKYVLSPRARRRRLLAQYRGVPIAQTEDGELVKLVGLVRYVEGSPPLVAPLSDREGVHYSVEVDQKKSNNTNARWTELIREHATHSEMWIEGPAEGERALVDLASADVELVMDGSWASGFHNDATPTLERFLARHGERSEGILFNKGLRYREGVLEEGERVAVLGRCIRELDPDPRAAGADGGYRSRPTRLHIIAPVKHPIIVTDDAKLFH